MRLSSLIGSGPNFQPGSAGSTWYVQALADGYRYIKLTWPLFIHISALGIWLGLVLVESIMELQKSSDSEYLLTVAKVHQKVDAFCEIPAFTTVLVTGVIMLDPTRMTGWYLAKVVCGCIAIAVNAWCVGYVIRRAAAAKAGNLAEVHRLTRLILITVPVGAPFALIALAIGLAWLAS